MQKYGTGEKVSLETDATGQPVDPQGIKTTAVHDDGQTYSAGDAAELAAESAALDREVDES